MQQQTISSSIVKLSVPEKEFLLQGLQAGLRLDGRGLLNQRAVTIQFGTDTGEVIISMGNTRIYGKTYLKLTNPK